MKKVFQTLFLLLLALFSLGQLGRIQLTKVSAIYAHDIVLVIWVCLSVTKYASSWKKVIQKILKNKFIIFTFSWITLGLILSAINTQFPLLPLLYLSRVITYGLFGLSLTFIKPFSRQNQLYLWIFIGLLIAFWGLLQYFFLPDTRFIKYLGWDDHYFRLISTQLDPNFTGIILILTLILTQKIKLKINWIKVITSFWLTLSLLLTYSRASYLSLLGSMILLIGLQLNKSHKINKLALTIIGLLIIGLPLLPRPAGEGVKLERIASVNSRIESSSSVIKDLKNYQWVTGKGLFTSFEPPQNSLEINDTAHFPDNLFIFILTSTGIIGLVLFLYILYKTTLNLYKKDVFILTAFIAILIHSQFNHTLFQPFIWLWLSSLGFSLGETKT